MANLESVSIKADRKILNPVLNPEEKATLTVTGYLSDGKAADMSKAAIRFTCSTKYTSGPVEVASVDENGVVTPLEGGIAAVTASVELDGVRKSGTTEIVVRPFYCEYHQTLSLKFFLGMKNHFGPGVQTENIQDVNLTFEDALEVIKKTDRLTRGIPKIVYLVGWQFDGHDYGYPSWSEVNERLKRSVDATALDSLRWLIREGRNYNTIVSLHINMNDAKRSSPLFDTYMKEELFARREDGTHYCSTFISEPPPTGLYSVSPTREWQSGYARKRIDGLLEMIPELVEGGTIHIDNWQTVRTEDGKRGPYSPYHGITVEQDEETQREIFRYWRKKGLDVTSEGSMHARTEPKIGLQPMTWHDLQDIDQLEIPACLYTGGRNDRLGGDPRFGDSMHAEELGYNDPENLSRFLDEFCTTTLPWYFLNRFERLGIENDVVFYSDGVTAGFEKGRAFIRRANVAYRDGDNLFVPALWKNHREIIAYSARSSYRQWNLPEDWKDVEKVDTYEIRLNGLRPIETNIGVNDDRLALSLKPGQALVIVPSGTETEKEAGRFDLVCPLTKTTGVNPETAAFYWEPSKNADTYHLVVSEDSVFAGKVVDVEIEVPAPGTPGAESHRMSELQPDREYFWKVEAINKATGKRRWNDGPASSFRTVTTQSPPAPANIRAFRISRSEVRLSWNSVANAGTYSIYRSRTDSADKFSKIVTDVTGSGYIDTGAPLEPGAVYSYIVSAVNGHGESSISETNLVDNEKYLSDLQWKSSSCGNNSVQQDKNVFGGPIRIHGVTYFKGLGTYSPSEVVYDLAGNFSAFKAIIGLDDRVRWSPAASVNMKIYADDELLFESGMIRQAGRRTPPIEVEVDVTGKRELKLVVDELINGNQDDAANWALARLI